MTATNTKLMFLTCSCCGGYASAYEQWHNRDIGYGMCGACIERIKRERPMKREPMSDDEIKRCYGVEGIHWFSSEVNEKQIQSRWED